MHKFTIINFFIGLTVAVVLSVLLVLTLKVIIPPPDYNYPYDSSYEPCGPGDDVCFQKQQARELEARDKQVEFQKQREAYGEKIFIGANIAGLAVLILGLLFFMVKWGTNIAAGMIVASTFTIFYGYVLGWQGADDKLKLLVGVIVAAIVVAGGIAINKMKDRSLAAGDGQSQNPPRPGAL